MIHRTIKEWGRCDVNLRKNSLSSLASIKNSWVLKFFDPLNIETSQIVCVYLCSVTNFEIRPCELRYHLNYTARDQLQPFWNHAKMIRSILKLLSFRIQV